MPAVKRHEGTPTELRRLRAAARRCQAAVSELRAAVVAAAAAGESVRAIAAEVGRDKNTIQTVVELVSPAEYAAHRTERIQDSTQPGNKSLIYLLGHGSPDIPALAEEAFRSREIFRRHRHQVGEKEIDDYLEGQRQRSEALAADLEGKITNALKAGTLVFRGRPTPAAELDSSS